MTPKFEILSQEVATQFLQSVVVVDDKAYLFKGDQVAPHEGLKSPQGILQKKELSEYAPTDIQIGDVIEKSHKLDAKALIDAFAEKGLICSVLTPKLGEDFQSKVLASASRADIVVLDWQLREDEDKDGTDAIRIINKIMDNEISQDRMRLIAVYSAESPNEIADKIATRGGFTRPDNYTLIGNALRICVFAKEGNVLADPNRIVNVEELPDRLIEEFAQMTKGLLANAALGGMAAIRRNTHKLIGKFRSDLDAPYLAHRILNDPPQEAETHIVPLIASEIESILNDSRVSDFLSIQKIEGWLDWRFKNVPSIHRRMHMKTKNDAKLGQ